MTHQEKMSTLNLSQDMFEETSSQAQVSDKANVPWLGTNISEFRKHTTDDYSPVKASSKHTVLFKLPIKDEILEPYPDEAVDIWDSNHVRMPHSSQSLYPVSESSLELRWPLVKTALRKNISSSKELEQAIFSYNTKFSQKWSFEALHHFFSKTLDPEETKCFFKTVFPGIVELALDIENKIRGGIPFLKKGVNKSISISQEQAAILLANAFLCTYPRRNSNTQNLQYPGINFNRLFQFGSLVSVQQKLKCFINYFRRVYKNRPQGVITFTRRFIKPNHLPIWGESDSVVSELHVSNVGTIEEEGAGMLEVDFANKYIGGGVLGRGSVQEEIKFLICPELVVSRLFTECLDDTEALIVIGCERYNKYIGYAETFTWAGNFIEPEPKRDLYRRLNSVVVAIDATHFTHSPSNQYKLISINRELNKAYTGFSFGAQGSIATGNWGCGAYKGDPRLKFLIQIMAASICKKNVAYFTFGDIVLRDDLYLVHEFFKKNNVTVGLLWKLLSSYYTVHMTKETPATTLYNYIFDAVSSKTDNSVQKNENSKSVNAIGNDVTEKDSNCMKNQEPVEALVYSLKTDEGRKRCLQTDKERWDAYQDAMSKLSASDLKNATNRTNTNKSAPVKRKISDYFNKTSQN